MKKIRKPHRSPSGRESLITKRYTLDQVNEGYQDLRDEKIIRGVIVHE